MSNINKAAVLNPFSDLTANILNYVPRATTSEFGIVAIGSGINVDSLGRIYLDTQEYSDRLTAIEAQAASSLATQKSEVAAAIAQVNLAQSQTITALTLEVNNLKTNLTDAITTTQTDLINRADQLAQNVTNITQQLTQDKAAFTKEIQDALVYLENASSVASALRTPRKIQGVDFDGTKDISLPTFTTQSDGLVPKREGATTTKYLREDGGWVVPPNTTYPLLTKAIAETGTSTTANTISAQVLKDAILHHTPVVTDITGNAGTATKLQTPRTIGGVSFDGTANINLAGVNIAGNQNTSGNAATATKLANARTISITGGVTGSVSFDGSANATIATTVTGLGEANGIATLDANGQVPSTQLPSYVDDVLEFVNVAAFPTTGVAGKIYVETTGNTTYRWGGTGYVKITSGEVSSVAGKVGVVTLTKSDVGLSNVDNTSDTSKIVASASKLTTARTLSWTGDATGSLSFNGTADVSTSLTLANSGVTAGTYKSVTVDAKGRVTAGNDVVTGLITSTTASGTANVATTNTNTFLNITEKVGSAISTIGSSSQITGAGTVTVASDKAGKITITGAAPSVFTTNEAGLVPARIGAEATKYLREDGTWVTPTNTTYTNMSAAEISAGTATTGRLITPKDLKTAVGTYLSSNITGVATIENGGTGATTAEQARTNLGLGSAATRNVGTQSGNVMGVGAFGLGGYSPSLQGTTFREQMVNKTGIYQTAPSSVFSDGVVLFINRSENYWYKAIAMPVGDAPPEFLTGVGGSSSWSKRGNFIVLNYNAAIDSNGFIKAASPIVKLFADKIELNDEARLQEITFEKLGAGDYLIKGSTGLALEGWYIEQPKDSNGNIFHAVEYGTHANGDIWLKTYEQIMEGTRIVADHTKPVDIKENRFISIRLNELPNDTSAPMNQTIVDNEGNPSPSHLHELEEGVWVISDENAAILEQERLAAMKPIKRRQFRLTLAMNGYDLKEVETLIDQIDDPMQRTIAQIEWQDATDFERTNPTLLMMAQMLGLTSEQVDSLWEYGLAL